MLGTFSRASYCTPYGYPGTNLFSSTSNKADLVKLKEISDQLKKHRPTLASSIRSLSLNSNQKDNLALVPGGKNAKRTYNRPDKPLKRALTVVRFVVRMQMAAREWEKHEHTRRRLAEAADEMMRNERMKKMRAEWKAQMAVKVGEVHV